MAYEDFTTYTEVDPYGRWFQSASWVLASGVRVNEDSYVYKDYGAGYFDGDYIHECEVKFQSSQQWGRFVLWEVTNNPGSLNDMTEGQYLFFYRPSSIEMTLRDKGLSNSSSVFTMTADTYYYLRIERSGSTVTCKIYSDSARTNLLDTLSVTCETDSYRYLVAGASNEGSGTYNAFGYIRNLEFLPVPLKLDDTINLSDNIEINLSREKAELEDTINLSDGIELNLSREKVELEDTINLSDEISFIFTEKLELEDTINLSDEIYTNIPQHSIHLEDTITLTDNIETVVYNHKIYDINNDFRTVVGVTKTISNKFSSVIEVVKDAQNIFSMAFGKIYTFLNDIRTLALSKYNLSNDFRMLKSWGVPGDAGFQSFGKEHIKVYINEVEQTDAIIDTVTINQVINGSHTATFDLGRAYDNTKPTIESSIKIKYYNWILYKGYITDIVPTNNPEFIRILCNDKYWKQNKTRKYFFVGHIPQDNHEKYYTHINSALSNELGWSPGVGNFIPQTMSCFGTGESDCITSLITNSGNFGWFYHTDKNNGNISKKLWIAGQGDIIYLDRQEIGKNLGLYQVLKHQFRESISNLVNKLRVQMGDLVIRRFNRYGGTKEYTSYRHAYIGVSPYPFWNNEYEIIAKDSNTGYGWDYHKPEDNDNYQNIYKKYQFLYWLSPDEEWSDRYPPEVTILAPWLSDWECSVPLEKGKFSLFPSSVTITEGFTIDYEEGTITFNEPIFLYKRNTFGEIANYRAPNIHLKIWKKIYHSNTENPDDNPEEDISNPLMFFTDKMGSYPETIIRSLELSGFSVQFGGWYISGQEEYQQWSVSQGKYLTKYRDIWTLVRSWNDTAFAKDYANWRLSKVCDKKITGSIEVTIDTLVFYNIDLSKQIMIKEVTENPLNITSISYNMNSFTAIINLESSRYYRRTVSLQSRGE